MVISMNDTATETEISAVSSKLEDRGFTVHRVNGVNRTILGAVGDKRDIDIREFQIMEGVHEVIRISEPYKLASRTFHQEDSVFRIGDVEVGGENVLIMAGPCSVESEEHIHEMAGLVKQAGAKILRGGAFKPRTSPYSFQGLGHEGLDYMAEAGATYGLPIITEVISPGDVQAVAEKADILQIGARNMQNFSLLSEVGRVHRPVMLKRGLMSSLEELLHAAEYILAQGNQQVFLCERGIRTFETATRNTLDLSAVPVLQERTHLPVIVDPSHAVGIRKFIEPVSLASIMAGADGIIVEVHENPRKAYSDGQQTINFDEAKHLYNNIRKTFDLKKDL